MAKTHHRRHRVNRTRRGGTKNASTAPATTTNHELQKILDRVKALGAQGQTPIKPSSRSGISKSQASQKRFADILAGKGSHSTKKPVSKHGSTNRAAPSAF